MGRIKSCALNFLYAMLIVSLALAAVSVGAPNEARAQSGNSWKPCKDVKNLCPGLCYPVGIYDGDVCNYDQPTVSCTCY